MGVHDTLMTKTLLQKNCDGTSLNFSAKITLVVCKNTMIFSVSSPDTLQFIKAKVTGEQGWRSGESTRLPSMWPWFDSRSRRHVG